MRSGPDASWASLHLPNMSESMESISAWTWCIGSPCTWHRPGYFGIMYARDVPEDTIFYHGTKADLKVGDLMTPGFGSNFVDRELKHIYFSATLEAATWGA